MLKKCEEDTGKNLSFPMDHTKSLIFAGWLLERNLSHATIDKYLSGLRQLHLVAGFPDPNLRTDLLKQIIKGRKNQNTVEETVGECKSRIPITPKLMLLMKKDIQSSEMSNTKKLLIWSISSLLFNGAFRISELLASGKTTFDPFSTLLETDIVLRESRIDNEKIKLIQVTLKTEKSNSTGKHTLVDVYESGGHLCPVKAFSKWSKHKNLNNRLPLFREEDGSPYTVRQFNQYLRDFSTKYLDLGDRSLTSHSFRAGITTMMAELGYTDLELMTIGRWSSRAFEDYIKVPRTRRLAIARQIAKVT